MKAPSESDAKALKGGESIRLQDIDAIAHAAEPHGTAARDAGGRLLFDAHRLRGQRAHFGSELARGAGFRGMVARHFSRQGQPFDLAQGERLFESDERIYGIGY